MFTNFRILFGFLRFHTSFTVVHYYVLTTFSCSRYITPVHAFQDLRSHSLSPLDLTIHLVMQRFKIFCSIIFWSSAQVPTVIDATAVNLYVFSSAFKHVSLLMLRPKIFFGSFKRSTIIAYPLRSSLKFLNITDATRTTLSDFFKHHGWYAPRSSLLFPH